VQAGLYISLASIPLFAAVYTVAANPGDNFVYRLVKKYEIGQEAEERKNIIHLKLMEEAAADRQLFASSPRDTNPVIRYPEYVQSEPSLSCCWHNTDIDTEPSTKARPGMLPLGKAGQISTHSQSIIMSKPKPKRRQDWED